MISRPVYDRQPESQGPTELVLVGSGSYEQSWRAIPTQRPGPRDMYPVLSGNLQVEHQGGQRGGLWSSPAPTLHIPRMSMHRSLLHNWLKGLVNPPSTDT